MKNKYLFVSILLAVILAAGLTIAYFCGAGTVRKTQKDKTLKVVTSFYPIYIAAENVIGDTEGVTLTNLTGEQTGCLHDYQLTTEDMKHLSKADVFLINGGGMESFLSSVAKQYQDLELVDTSASFAKEAAARLEEEEKTSDARNKDTAEKNESEPEASGEEEESNAHYWMNMADYQKQVQAIAEGLSKADPDHAEAYAANARAYQAKIQKLIDASADLKKKLSGRRIIVFHEALEFFAENFDMKTVADLDLDEERQVSANEVSGILGAIRNDGVRLVLAERLYGESMGNTVQSETDAEVLYMNTLVRGKYSKDAYLTGMQSNIDKLRKWSGQ
ncbi:MAG: metal ABC transporter substrate-binding protein [Eubacterium sp.]|jgi:zinc transport system substrate-binding protein